MWVQFTGNLSNLGLLQTYIFKYIPNPHTKITIRGGRGYGPFNYKKRKPPILSAAILTANKNTKGEEGCWGGAGRWTA